VIRIIRSVQQRLKHDFGPGIIFWRRELGGAAPGRTSMDGGGTSLFALLISHSARTNLKKLGTSQIRRLGESVE
jgi:hypothetical protein